MARESVSGRSSSPVSEKNGSFRNGGDRNGDRSGRDKNRDSTSSERALRDRGESEKLVYQPRNSDTTVELFSDSLKCLMPGTYLNDEVVQVYISYLINEKCDPSLTKRCHVFDSYFHKALKETFSPKPPKNKEPDEEVASQDSTGSGRTQTNMSKWKTLNKWFNGMDIFEKNFLIFPACHDTHWFAIIVCYPKEVCCTDHRPVSPDSTEPRNKPVPGIIILDSLGLKRSLLTKEIRYFLDFEWRTRLTEIKDFYYHNLREYKPKLPKQTNPYDCGIFMLAYLKAFLKEPEKFYKFVRRNQEGDQEKLAQMVNMELTACSRESIKTTIHRRCRVEKPKVK